MRKARAEQAAREWEVEAPCTEIVMIVNGSAVLAERSIRPPQWLIPAESWVVLFRYRCGYLRGLNVLCCDDEDALSDAVQGAFDTDPDRATGWVDAETLPSLCGQCSQCSQQEG